MIAELTHQEFIEKFGGVYEHSSWVAEICFDKAHHMDANRALDLAGPLSRHVESATPELQMALLRAHPDLAGKLAQTGELTADSTAEQAGAGLDQCTEAELHEFTDLNTAYREKFGFPYILAVKGRKRLEILDNFRKRLEHDIATEFREALNQVHQIARLRLEAMDQD